MMMMMMITYIVHMVHKMVTIKTVLFATWCLSFKDRNGYDPLKDGAVAPKHVVTPILYRYMLF
jgi:hypothetical protein